jgi:hypothetical protein
MFLNFLIGCFPQWLKVTFPKSATLGNFKPFKPSSITVMTISSQFCYAVLANTHKSSEFGFALVGVPRQAVVGVLAQRHQQQTHCQRPPGQNESSPVI